MDDMIRSIQNNGKDHQLKCDCFLFAADMENTEQLSLLHAYSVTGVLNGLWVTLLTSTLVLLVVVELDIIVLFWMPDIGVLQCTGGILCRPIKSLSSRVSHGPQTPSWYIGSPALSLGLFLGSTMDSWYSWSFSWRVATISVIVAARFRYSHGSSVMLYKHGDRFTWHKAKIFFIKDTRYQWCANPNPDLIWIQFKSNSCLMDSDLDLRYLLNYCSGCKIIKQNVSGGSDF